MSGFFRSFLIERLVAVLGLTPIRHHLMTGLRFGAAMALLVVVYGGLLVHTLRSAAMT